MNILFCTPEYYPLIKTGGLADVASALPNSWAKEKNNVFVVLPGYSQVFVKTTLVQKIGSIHSIFNDEDVEIFLSTDFLPVQLVIIKSSLFENKDNPYLDNQGNDWQNNFESFSLFSSVCAQLTLPNNILNTKFDIAVSNDWQTGLVQAYIKNFSQTILKYKCKGVHIIHNIAYPGIFSAIYFHQLKLPHNFFNTEGLEYYHHISFQKAALFYADYIFTVSPNYAEQIQTSDEHGMGFQGLLSHQKKITGILNGVDYEIWNPLTDKLIHTNYSQINVKNKHENKISLKQKIGLETDHNRLLIGIVSRLNYHKGFDVLIDYFNQLATPLNIDWVVLGTGDAEMVDAFKNFQNNNSQFRFVESYNEKMSHEIFAGIDAFFMPSRSEPCGLTQLYAMAYGVLPIVYPTGGLKDSVMDYKIYKNKATGFYINALNIQGLDDVLSSVNEIFNNKKVWQIIQENAFKQNFSWQQTQKKYIQYFKKIITP